jgi:hypothetical protein
MYLEAASYLFGALAHDAQPKGLPIAASQQSRLKPAAVVLHHHLHNFAPPVRRHMAKLTRTEWARACFLTLTSASWTMRSS